MSRETSTISFSRWPAGGRRPKTSWRCSPGKYRPRSNSASTWESWSSTGSCMRARRTRRHGFCATQPPVTENRLGGDHAVHAEQLLRIGPDFFRRESRPLAQFLEFGDRVLAGNFGVDGFTRRKIEPPPGDVHELRVQALQVHLDAAHDRIVESLVTKALH